MNKEHPHDIEWASQSEWMHAPQQDRSRKSAVKVVNAAVVLFCKKGFEQTSLADIARLSKVSMGSIYGRFSDKDAILYAVAESYYATRIAQLGAILESAEAGQGDPRSVTELFARVMVSAFRQDRAMLRLLEISRITDKVIARQAIEADERVMRAFAGAYEAVADTSLPPDFEQRFQRTYYLIRHHLVALAMLEPMQDPWPDALDAPDLREQVSRICRLTLFDTATAAR